MLFKTYSLKETKDLAVNILAILPAQMEGATILALYGDLGAGKTSFTQGLAAALGVTETISSPTFVIEKIYDLPLGQKFKRLIHIDAYRLDNGADLLLLGFAEVCGDPGNLIVLEWPERVVDVLPQQAWPLRFTFIDDKTRTIEYGN
jgi:tRNA threonylcarbamoyladenosine biosynthesis protein TsaE